MRFSTLTATMILAGSLVPASEASAQTTFSGRFSLYAQASRQSLPTETRTFDEYISTLTLRSPSNQDGGFEYAFDARSALYPSTDTQTQVSLYDAYVGFRSDGGSIGVRVGQMWLNELGGLGSLGGILVDVRQTHRTRAGRLRFALFGGLEPKYFETGYTPDIRKAGGFLALEADNGRRHVLGYVMIRNAGLTERSVISMTNFIPSGRTFFLYQTAEYDLRGPGGDGRGGLNYFYASLRYAPVQALEVLATYHHGRSIDARTITTDLLNGRPVSPAALEGFLFESAGGRITVTPIRNLRVWGGFWRDRNNRGEAPTDRITGGLSASNILSTGFDFTVSDSHYKRPQGPFDSLYISLGKTLGTRVYVTADYTTSLSVFQFVRSDGVMVESRPHSRRYSLSSTLNLSRALALLLTGERLVAADETDDRLMLGMSVRF